MRIEAFVNGAHLCTAGLSGEGYIGAHLNLALRSAENEGEQTLRLSGIETRETESIYLDWPTSSLRLGDEVTLRILPAGASTPAISSRSSTEAPENLFSSESLASELLSACSEFESRLASILENAKTGESAAEYETFLRAVGEISAALGERLLYPVYRRHPALVPEQLRGQIL